jgi:hypothetical protein
MSDLFESIVHGLRMQGWSRIEAEAEALSRIARGIEAQRGETAQQARSEGRKPGSEGTRPDTGGQQQRNGK